MPSSFKDAALKSADEPSPTAGCATEPMNGNADWSLNDAFCVIVDHDVPPSDLWPECVAGAPLKLATLDSPEVAEAGETDTAADPSGWPKAPSSIGDIRLLPRTAGWSAPCGATLKAPEGSTTTES